MLPSIQTDRQTETLNESETIERRASRLARGESSHKGFKFEGCTHTQRILLLLLPAWRPSVRLSFPPRSVSVCPVSSKSQTGRDGRQKEKEQVKESDFFERTGSFLSCL